MVRGVHGEDDQACQLHTPADRPMCSKGPDVRVTCTKWPVWNVVADCYRSGYEVALFVWQQLQHSQACLLMQVCSSHCTEQLENTPSLKHTACRNRIMSSSCDQAWNGTVQVHSHSPEDAGLSSARQLSKVLLL